MVDNNAEQASAHKVVAGGALRSSATEGSRDVDLLPLFVKALRRLGQVGYPDDANRIAARAWSLLRHDDPVGAERINGTMHYLARLDSAEADVNNKEKNMAEDIKLDVRTEIPARRHQLIFETYTGLGAGEGFELINDHDPKPLYYQFEAEHNGQFTWEYLEEGPETWRVRIGRVGA